MAASTVPGTLTPHGIIDIGSNSIRLVVWQGKVRVPSVMFNEKVMAALGRTAPGGVLDKGAMDRTEAALARFALVAREIGVESLRAVATAAVRDARNREQFLARVRKNCGLEIEILSGEAEAEASALGVIAAIPDADGIVGDLGGGSLELVRIRGGKVHERLSVPLGSLRLAELRASGPGKIDRAVRKALKGADWLKAGAGKPFYAVGGSWRALAHLHMHLVRHPLPMVHHYLIPSDATGRLVRALGQMSLKSVRAVPNISSSRAATLPGAAMLLAAVVKQLSSSGVIASAWGLREGLMFSGLPEDVQAQDPLIAATRAEGQRQGRLSEHGDILNRWMNGIFADQSAEDRRLRHAACLLGDVAWRAHPDFRAERGLDVALHGNWVGIDARGRAMIALALFVNFGGDNSNPAIAPLEALVGAEAAERARRWGLAIRLGHRLGGGSAAVLEASRLSRESTTLLLSISPEFRYLYGESIIRRHKGLATAMGCEPKLAIG